MGPVGGRLKDFKGSWALITSDQWVLDSIGLGYALEFTSAPPSDILVRPTPVPSEPAKRHALEEELASLLRKRAARILPPDATQDGFMSTFFLVPKKEPGIWRPILNLKPLNQFIRPRRFRMDTLKTVLRSIQTPVWGASIDLRDAYLHIPVRPDHWKYLRFQYRDVQYEFTALPFGLSTSPRVFSRIVKTMAVFLRKLGIMVFMYLDDWIIIDRSRAATVRALELTWRLATNLGLL